VQFAVSRFFGRRDNPADAADARPPASELADAPTYGDPAEADPTGDAKISVVVVDDDDDVREMMMMALDVGGFAAAGDAADGPSALWTVTGAQPDNVLLDLHMPDTNGLELLPELREASPKTKFVVFSAIGATYMTEAAIQAGAIAFIEKGVSPRSILRHLERVHHSGSASLIRPFPLNREYPAEGNIRGG
jgi:DNA-binding NtrC family response regulator